MDVRKNYWRRGGILAAVLLLLTAWSVPGALAQMQAPPLNPNKIPQFVDPLPLLTVQGGPIETIDKRTSTTLETISMQEFTANILPVTTKLDKKLMPNGYVGTKVWGYRKATPNPPISTYIGPVFVTKRNQATPIKFSNSLPNNIASSQVPFINFTIDTTLHWANPKDAAAGTPYLSGPIPTAVHLHGGEVPPELDGGPDAWWTDGNYFGHAYYTKGFKGEVQTLPTLPDPNYPTGSIVFDAAQGYKITNDGNTWTTYFANYAEYDYPNKQEASPIWFHDHGLGITRLNVYAGLAGAYIITDPAHPSPQAQLNEPTRIIPLVIQDRMFTVEGELYFDNAGINPTIHPYWVPEFVGDVICVNGKSWPFLNVGLTSYRFLVLNGSNARAYELDLFDRATGLPGPPMWVIGTDGGYLDKPVMLDPALKQKLVIMPGERYEVIINFANAGGYAGQVLEMRNTARTPYPGGAPVQGSTTGRIMRFNVLAPTPANPAPVGYTPVAGNSLRSPAIERLVNVAAGAPEAGVTPTLTRQITLNELMGAGGPLEVLLNNTRYDGIPKTQPPGGPTVIRLDFKGVTVAGNTTYYSELPQEGETELWEIVNLTADAHPIHLHLVQFQLMNRQAFNLAGYLVPYTAAMTAQARADGDGPPYSYDNAGNPDYAAGAPFPPAYPPVEGGNPNVNPFLVGLPMAPNPWEAGWKDTVIMFPGQVTRILVRWAPTDATATAKNYFPFNPNGQHGYVWHCHIIDHEDNEMMRPTQVQANPDAPDPRPYAKGTDY